MRLHKSMNVINLIKSKKMEKIISDSLSEKTSLLQELYHRTKNNMQICFSNFTSFNGYSVENLDSAEFTARIESEAVFLEMQSNIQQCILEKNLENLMILLKGLKS